MRITFITTINHNVGDDFVREGILFLIGKTFGETYCSFIHKHIPLTCRPEWEWIYRSGTTKLLDKLPRLRGLFWTNLIDHLPVNKRTDKILNCDLLIQCGAPVYWNHAHDNEWYSPLIRRRYLTTKNRVPFLNIAAGTCLPYYADVTQTINDIRDVNFIKELFELCKITTVRDLQSARLLADFGLRAPVIPCPSIFARDYWKIAPRSPEYVALNFMPYGGHTFYSQNINNSDWENVFTEFYHNISKIYPVVFVCHNNAEAKEAARLFPHACSFIGESSHQYLEFYSKAKFYIGCRVHGAFATASFGRPAHVIGNDSRALMMKQIGLNSSYVSETTTYKLFDIYKNMENMYHQYGKVFVDIREQALDSYLKVIGVNLIHNKERMQIL